MEGSNTAFSSLLKEFVNVAIPYGNAISMGRTGRSRDGKGKGDPSLDVDVPVLPQASTFPQVAQNNTRNCQEEGCPLPLIVILCSKELYVFSLISFLMDLFLSQE